jgi:hypothetical protein
VEVVPQKAVGIEVWIREKQLTMSLETLKKALQDIATAEHLKINEQQVHVGVTRG